MPPQSFASAPPEPAARAAGALYFVLIGFGMTAQFVLRGPALALPDSALTAAPLRLSIAFDVAMMAADIALAVIFFLLLRTVSQGAALTAMVLRLMQAGLIGASLIALTGAAALVEAQQPALARQMAAMHAAGYDLGLIFFGGNSLAMAWLLCRGGAVPRAITAGIGAAGLVYIAGGFLRLLSPALMPLFEPAYLIALVAEVALALWLLVTGRIANRAG